MVDKNFIFQIIKLFQMSSQMANKSIPLAAGNPVLPSAQPPSTISRDEHNRIKQKLEDDVKQGKKKAKMLKSLLNHSLGIPSVRTKICLDVPNFAAELEHMQTLDRGNRYTIRSQTVDLVAGCQWTMDVLADYSIFGIYFHVNHPFHYQQHFYGFHVNYSLRVLGKNPSFDIHTTGHEEIILDDVDLRLISWNLLSDTDMEGFPENFLHSDGTIKLELDFTVDKVTFVDNGDSDEEAEENNE